MAQRRGEGSIKKTQIPLPQKQGYHHQTGKSDFTDKKRFTGGYLRLLGRTIGQVGWVRCAYTRVTITGIRTRPTVSQCSSSQMTPEFTAGRGPIVYGSARLAPCSFGDKYFNIVRMKPHETA